jgi:thiol-disulfide isomerase/thioredoxin
MLKNILILTIGLLMFSCKNDAPKDYVTISGKITNHLGNNGSIKSRGYSKELTINKDGTFSDTLHLKAEGALYSFSDGNEFSRLYLKNGDNIKMTVDTKEFDETIKYTGTGSANNNYLAAKSLLSEKLFSANLFDLDEGKFSTKVDGISKEFTEFITSSKNLDPALLTLEKEEIGQMKDGLLQQYKMMKAQKAKSAALIGKPSPTFNNYENVNGKKTSLKDLRGKYVYVDVWATWCGPCKAEIPSLKALEKEYHGKDIEFVSISVDNGRGYADNSLEASKEGWKKMIAEKEMKGIQLFADKAWKSDFVTGYGIRGIPRFILIDKKGNIVDPDAPRPSSESIKNILKGLNL